MNNIKVTLLSKTENLQNNIALAAKLCYSGLDGSELFENINNSEDNEEYIEMLMSLGHESPIEHSYFIFLIEGISRSCSHQIVRHRISSYSQKSQRYVQKQSGYVTPPEIQNDIDIHNKYIESITRSFDDYDSLSDMLLNKYLLRELIDEFPVYDEYNKTDYKNYLVSLYNASDKVIPQKRKSIIKDTIKKCTKLAIEDARYVLPNACETQLVMSMNARALNNFFKHRLCNRAQWEIREMAQQMFELVNKECPTIFKNALPSCVNGVCNEGSLTCGKIHEMRNKYKQFSKY